MARFELHTQYTITLPAGELSDAGVRAVMQSITAVNFNAENSEWRALNPNWANPYLPQLADSWQWAWVVQKGEYAGTLPKRIRNYYFKAHGIKCPDSFIQEIGNIARQHTNSNTVYRFEIVDEFDWQAGDFGDYGSCYWGGNAGARIMLKDNGGMAICFMTDSGTGYARAWLVEIDDNLFVIFNGYGFERGVYATLTITRVFATFMALTYKKIHLDNSYGSTLYINSGAGYIIGTPESIEGIDEWDFEWHDIDAYSCYSCGCGLDEYEGYTGADDETYCESCFYDRFDRCQHCDETHYQENIYYVEIDDTYLCRVCRARSYDRCKGCDEWFEKGTLHIHEMLGYCWDCLNDVTSPPGWAE